MIPSVADTLRALDNPRIGFERLIDVRRVDGADIMRNSSFTEFLVEWQGRRWLLCTPSSDDVIHRAEQTIHHINHTASHHIAESIILRKEMHFIDSMGHEHLCDILMQHLPDGLTLDKAAVVYPAEMLNRGLDEMQREFSHIGFTHHALKPQNIVVTRSGCLMAIRCYRSSFNAERPDNESFDRLREFVYKQHTSPCYLSDYESSTYITTTTSIPHDGMLSICEGGHYGYADEYGNVVIAARFDKTSDFHEGRAVVEVGGKSALIDKAGNYILEPHYDHIEFHEDYPISLARTANRWRAFDYHGNALGPSYPTIGKLTESLRNRFKITIEI